MNALSLVGLGTGPIEARVDSDTLQTALKKPLPGAREGTMNVLVSVGRGELAATACVIPARGGWAAIIPAGLDIFSEKPE